MFPNFIARNFLKFKKILSAFILIINCYCIAFVTCRK
uniref:Uncharacterized protein n=1 Tax=Rhizophora mucronata TaxID=61149 RepID=A0A2P2QSV1_RHIMU